MAAAQSDSFAPECMVLSRGPLTLPSAAAQGYGTSYMLDGEDIPVLTVRAKHASSLPHPQSCH